MESLYPEDMGPSLLSTEEFLSDGLSLMDAQVAERVKAASLKGNVLRFVCLIENSRYYFPLTLIRLS